ncbi:patatin-like phospholipase family protein [Porphyromonadaceae sp. NP-X]|nr:patatin-like phospholipase family protein [Paludibacteraceae bacterium]MDS1032124.1 patatin-like phospholipase family protein [Porphyromonadaceae sp. NP-X]NLJ19741.1 patatin [Bacteroidales bacterium]
MKKRYLLLFLLLLFYSLSSTAQKVGLVLSGGGAKGITHIGVIKALEENGIPIDYVAGTSMGAIVGSMYAMGLTPEEMMKIIKSDDFKYWLTGQDEPEYVAYFRNGDQKPEFMGVSFRFNPHDTVKVKSNILPTHIVPTHQLNYAFLALFSQATAISDKNFDRLFVPFRCVASDISEKVPVVFNKGSLGDAVRASMTFPLVFKPIVIDDRLLFDGGIYNNFPVDVMRKDFSPDIMIGSVVAKNPEKPTEDNLILQIENMVMSQTDYVIPKEEGFMFRFDLRNFNMFDFAKADQLYQMGYDSALQKIELIKSAISRRISEEELNKKRQDFRNEFPELKFQKVYIDGIDSLQKLYVEREFHTGNEVFDLNSFKKSYFNLLSDNQISEITPIAVYNKTSGFFDLHLKVKTEDHLKVTMGANISSMASNQAYIGFSYQNLKEYAQTAYLDAQFGRMYNALGLGVRMDAAAKTDFYVKFGFVTHKFDYFEGSSLFYNDNRISYFNQQETYGKLSIGFPLTKKGRIEFGLGGGYLTDHYFQNKSLITSGVKNDQSNYLLGSVFINAESNTLNRPNYATSGSYYAASLQLAGGNHNEQLYYPTERKLEGQELWLQFLGKYDRYVTLSKKVSLGTYGELAISNRKLLPNYTATVIQAPAFRPTLHSTTIFNEGYSANQYAAFGLKPIYNFSDQLHFRTEAYCFVPYKTIYRLSDESAAYSKSFSNIEFISEAAVVLSFRKATLSAFLNYYSAGASHWNVGFNVGILLFNKKFLQ